MKRFATMMGAMLLVPTMVCAELIEIAELTKEVPENWLEKIDVNGKTVSVDVPIYIPNRQIFCERCSYIICGEHAETKGEYVYHCAHSCRTVNRYQCSEQNPNRHLRKNVSEVLCVYVKQPRRCSEQKPANKHRQRVQYDFS